MVQIKLSKSQALFIRAMRVEMECTFGRVSELFGSVYPDLGIHGGQEEGRQLCGIAQEMLNEDFDAEAERRQILLGRALSTVDFETTGPDPAVDRIVSVAITRINKDLTKTSTYSLVNPGIPIPPESTEIHGITDEMVKDAPTLDKVAPQIIEMIRDTDVLTYNGLKFDIPLFNNECARIGITWDYSGHAFPDAFQVFQYFHSRKLADAYRVYVGGEMQNAHNAQADTEATAEIFMEQLQAHPELPLDMLQLQRFLNKGMPMADLSGKFFYDKNGNACYRFGKHKGKTVAEVVLIEPTYAPWVLSSDFPEDSKNFLTTLLTQQQ